MPCARDKIRLAKGEAAKLLDEPQTLAEIEAQIDELREAKIALQSTDDLGSEEANDRCWNDINMLHDGVDETPKRNGEKDRYLTGLDILWLITSTTMV